MAKQKYRILVLLEVDEGEDAEWVAKGLPTVITELIRSGGIEPAVVKVEGGW